MLLVVDRHSGPPVYRQLMDQIRFHVASGLLAPGDELPSTRALSSELGLNPMTVSKAYGLLEREGVVERRPGRSLVVLPLETDQIRAERLAQLEKSLAAPATMARQLGLTNEEALALFERLLDREAAGGDESSRRSV